MDRKSTARGRRPGQECAHADGDDLAARGDSPRHGERRRDRGDLRLLDRGGDRLQIAVGQLFGIGAHDARQPGADLDGTIAAAVGNVHVHCSGVRLPRSRCASAAIANNSEETGHG